VLSSSRLFSIADNTSSITCSGFSITTSSMIAGLFEIFASKTLAFPHSNPPISIIPPADASNTTPNREALTTALFKFSNAFFFSQLLAGFFVLILCNNHNLVFLSSFLTFFVCFSSALTVT
jgi:hypothetical protein